MFPRFYGRIRSKRHGASPLSVYTPHNRSLRASFRIRGFTNLYCTYKNFLSSSDDWFISLLYYHFYFLNFKWEYEFYKKTLWFWPYIKISLFFLVSKRQDTSIKFFNLFSQSYVCRTTLLTGKYIYFPIYMHH